MMTGEKLKAAGFSDEEAQTYDNLIKAGFSHDEIISHFGSKKAGTKPVEAEIGGNRGVFTLQTGEEPTGAIDTRTNKPIMQPVQNREPSPVGYGTLMKAGFVDDLKAKAALIEKSIGKPVGYDDAGKLVFQTSGGNIQHLIPQDVPIKKIAAGAAESVPKLIPATGAAVGAAMGGPGGAVAGGSIGEGVRRAIGVHVFGDEPDVWSTIKSMALEGGTSVIGAGGGKAVAGAFEGLLARRAGDIKKTIVDDIAKFTPRDHAKAMALKAIGDKYGIQLLPHQLYDKASLVNVWKLLRKLPETSDSIRAVENMTDEQIEGGVKKFWQEMGLPYSPVKVGERLADESRETLKTMQKQRTKATSPIYREAIEKGGDVDVEPVVQWIDEQIKTRGKGDVLRALEQTKKEVLNPDLPSRKTSVVDGGGEYDIPTTIKGEPSYESGFQRLDNAQKSLRRLAEQAGKAEDWELESIYKTARSKLMGQMEAVSPRYKNARNVSRMLAEKIEDVKRGPLGQFAKLENDKDVARTVDMLFDPKQVDAMGILEVKNYIEPKNPQFWRDLMATKIKRTYDGLKESQGTADVINVPGKMRQALFGSESQRELWKAATSGQPQLYKNMENFFTLMQAAAQGRGSESMTAPFLKIYEKLSQNVGGVKGQLARLGGAATQPLATIRRKIFETWNDRIVSGKLPELMESLASPAASQKLQYIKGLGTGTTKAFEATAAFLADIGKEAVPYREMTTDADEYMPRLVKPEDRLRQLRPQQGR